MQKNENIKFVLKKGDLKVFLKARAYKAGRGGRILCRHKGGSLVKRYLKLNFLRRIFNVLGQIISIEKDPLRSGLVALVFYKSYGVYEYILCPHGVSIGQFLVTYNTGHNSCLPILKKFFFNIGNSFFLQDIKIGSHVFNVELVPGFGAKLLRAAGTSARIIQRIKILGLNIFVVLRLKTGKIFCLKGNCLATVGQCSNVFHRKLNLKKAGIVRNLGIRPVVRGVAMNPVDHPHGGGEGKTSGGRCSVSPWGKLTKGKKTVKKMKRLKQQKIFKRFRLRFASR